MASPFPAVPFLDYTCLSLVHLPINFAGGLVLPSARANLLLSKQHKGSWSLSYFLKEIKFSQLECIFVD